MRHTEDTFQGAGGIDLYRQSWLPTGEPAAVVVLVHGVGEHSGRYMRVVGPLTEAGYAVCAYDQRGHGRSPGPRVHIDRWAQYREDLAAFLGVVAAEHPDRPTVIYGHSMGSLVVLDYLLTHPGKLDAAIISGVAIEPVGVGSPAQIAMARLLTGVLPRMSLNLGIDPQSLTHDQAAVEEYRNDPLLVSRATVRWGTESLDTVERVKQRMGSVNLPMLVLHGGEDPLNRVDGATALFDAVPHSDKELRIYPDTYHEPHNDLVHEQVATDIRRWVSRVVQRSS